MRAEEYQAEQRELAGIPMRVESYKIGDRYYCHTSNVDPGATVARAEGGTRADAIDAALLKVANRLSKKPPG